MDNKKTNFIYFSAVVICALICAVLILQQFDKTNEMKSSFFSDVASYESFTLTINGDSYNIPYRLFVPDGVFASGVVFARYR